MVKYVVKKGRVFWPSKAMKKIAWANSEKIYKEASESPAKFWAKAANELFWFKKWHKTYEQSRLRPWNFRWFVGGKTNACYNALDIHLPEKANQTALIWIPEPEKEPDQNYTYEELHELVCKAANMLKSIGVRRGDIVTIYLPMIPELIISMLACARIGAIHSVVFSAFSSQALKTRLLDNRSRFLITADGYYRRGKLIKLKEPAEQGARGTAVEKIIVVNRARRKIRLKNNEFWWHLLMEEQPLSCPAEELDSNSVMFLLYTSGTTGKPKGIIHELGGYMVHAYLTAKLVFDLHENDVMFCTADIGWITGHSYACYGPLFNGITSIIYEGSPDWPSWKRFFSILEKYNVTVFYTAPTLIRMMVANRLERLLARFKFEKLRILGSVGEPIDEETWLWFFRHVGKSRCPIVDTWWQTEGGGVLISSLPGIGPFIPGVAGRSFPGVNHLVLDEGGRPVSVGKEGYLVQASPFAPGMLSGVWRNSKLYREKYWSQYHKYYFSGDGAYMLKGKLFRITGRVDDVIKVAGHRLSTAEIENAINKHPLVVESAVVAKLDKIKGNVPVAFVVVNKKKKNIEQDIIGLVAKEIGPIAKPHIVYVVPDLPKTRSGKIMRRVLRALMLNETVGDVSTLVNPEVIGQIERIVKV